MYKSRGTVAHKPSMQTQDMTSLNNSITFLPMQSLRKTLRRARPLLWRSGITYAYSVLGESDKTQRHRLGRNALFFF